MPEYLAPGVYVEEVDTGSKPIEGVSTSTAGMVGVTERGPVNVPVLITSVGEFRRWYGGQLRALDYPAHCYFPHSIEGFFSNGGKRVYVVRALDDGAATRAFAPLFDRGDTASAVSRLVRASGEGTGSAPNQPGALFLAIGALGNGDWVRVGDGSNAEYRQFDSSLADETLVVPQLPLSATLPDGATIEDFVPDPVVANFTLNADANAGDSFVQVIGATADVTALATAVATGVTYMQFGTATLSEYRMIAEATQQTLATATDSTLRLRLSSDLMYSHAAGATADQFDASTPAMVNDAIVEAGIMGEAQIEVSGRSAAFAAANMFRVVDGTDIVYVGQIGQLNAFDMVPGCYDDLDAGTLIEGVSLTANLTVLAAPAPTTTTFTLNGNPTFVAGQQIVVDPTGANEVRTVLSVTGAAVVLTAALTTAPAATNQVLAAPKLTTAAVNAGGRVLAVDDRMGIQEEMVIQVGAGGTSELVTVMSLPATSLTAPNAGNIVVSPGLSGAFPAGTPIQIVGVAPTAGRQACSLALPADGGETEILVSDGTAYAATEIIRITTQSGSTTYHTLTDVSGAITPQMVNFMTALSRSHPSGSTVVQRTPLMEVQALDAGIWGNRLRISVQDETHGLVSTTLATAVNPNSIRLASPAGVQAGTVLEFYNALTGVAIGDPVKVSNINRAANNTITVQGGGLTAAQSVPGTAVRSREFRLTVSLLRQPDPTTPTRDDQVIEGEDYRNLSMDPRHSNYIEKAIGDIDGAIRPWDRRPEGPSLYVRVRDLAPDLATEESVRLGPEALLDLTRSGRWVPAKYRLDQTTGSDSIASLADTHYIGLDNADPDLRTGLLSLLNVEDVSIVAIPGQTSTAVQQAVIDHCELMRYRFAVLDSRREPNDTITDVQDQRQSFDTKYAALYYPWLSIPDPYPLNLANVQEYAIPPSGHMIGVYARTDIERGVHKAPANEVVRGIVGLRRRINKEQQDILNPYPVNINVIRDFRNNNRGIRVYGGRCITSDSDWKYVNVRRLTIFIEHSLERGLQWVVFEPNAEPLWARVTRSIKNFLTTVWRNGALEGTKVEEAFFVKCDRSTMTQTDIDSGRLIVLVGIAPVKPAEFVIVRIGLWTARSDS